MSRKLSVLVLLIIVGCAATVIVRAANLQNAFNGNSLLNSAGTQAGYNVAQTDVNPVISNVTTFLLSFLGVIFLGLMIYGGFVWMTAQGDAKKVDMAGDLIRAAIIGLIIVLLAYAISYFIFAKLAATTLK